VNFSLLTKIKAVAAFSPREYFKTIDVQNSNKNTSKLVFATSFKNEAYWNAFLK
tara:strand:- start:1014 stop:1175 length:162 start_codon:yes stop_codon:yes gene_type:complete